jgi:hypothetical protein
MTRDDVTHVTRNRREVPPELKLLIDLVASAAVIYYATHPACLDDIGTTARRQWGKVRHRVSVWTTRQDIRSLPETDE